MFPGRSMAAKPTSNRMTPALEEDVKSAIRAIPGMTINGFAGKYNVGNNKGMVIAEMKRHVENALRNVDGITYAVKIDGPAMLLVTIKVA